MNTGMAALSSDITKMMCTDEYAMKNSIMSRESCDAVASGDMKLAMEHMEKKHASMNNFQKKGMEMKMSRHLSKNATSIFISEGIAAQNP